MSEESTSRELGPIRPLKDAEKVLMRRLLQLAAPTNVSLLSRVDSLTAQEMLDGGMGSLYFALPGRMCEHADLDNVSRSFNSTTPTESSSWPH